MNMYIFRRPSCKNWMQLLPLGGGGGWDMETCRKGQLIGIAALKRVVLAMHKYACPRKNVR